MSFSIDRKIKIGYFTAFLLLLLSYLLLFSTTSEMLKQTELNNQAKESNNRLELLFSQLTEVETTYRGYLLVNNEEFLESYYIGKIKIDSTLNNISKLIYKNPALEQRFENLKSLINKRMKLFEVGLTLYEAGNHNISDSIKLLSYQGKAAMNDIRQKVNAMEAYQSYLMRIQTSSLSSSSSSIKVINLTSLFIASLMAIYSLITYSQENKARRKADEQTALYSIQLEHRVKELNTANNELKQLRSIEKFASTGRIARTIAHEVRNPLTNIGLANNQLREAIGFNEETDMLLNMIERNSERINQLASNLLNSTKFEELNLAPVSINQLLDETLEMAKDRLELNNIKVEKKYTNDICKVSADGEKIKIAFLNIIVNAIEAMKPGEGILQISTSNINKMCSVRITDNGVGMAAESLPKLFEPFFTNKEKGNGLGLTNTQNIILNHKGNITVESEVAKGTSFTINLEFTK